MSARITVTLHELVAAMDGYADAYLQRHFAVSFNLFEFLNVLTEHAPIDITDLAKCLRVSKAAVSKRIPGLTADGWVTTTPAGGRRIELTPTAAATDLVQRAGGELEREFASAFSANSSKVDANAVSIDVLNERLNDLTRIFEQKEMP